MSFYRVDAATLESAEGPEREQIERKLKEGLRAKPNGGIQATLDRLAWYEQRHGMTTAELRVGISSGEIVETEEFTYWLFAASLHDRLTRSR